MAVTETTDQTVDRSGILRPGLQARPRAERRGQLGEVLRRAGLGLVGVLITLGVWQLLSAVKFLTPTAVPSATKTFHTLFTAFGTPRLWTGFEQTLEGTALGFAIGTVAGVLGGVVIGVSDGAYRSTFLIVEFFKTIPVITIMPLAVLLFGTSIDMKLMIVAFGVFFPTLIQTMYGVRSVDPVVDDTARVFRLGRWARFIWVTLPSAAPYIATGMRLGATAALLLDILAELVAGANGLGLLILRGEAGGAINYSYAIIVFTGIIGIALIVGLTAVERRVMHWHELYRGQ